MPCSAALREACNLWTQELHTNCIQALSARPETDDAGHFAPIGVEFGLAKEDGIGAGFVIFFPSRPVGGRDHDGQLDAIAAQPIAVPLCKIPNGAAVGLDVHNQQFGSMCGRIVKTTPEGREPLVFVTQMQCTWAAAFCQRAQQEPGRMRIVVNHVDDGQNVQTE